MPALRRKLAVLVAFCFLMVIATLSVSAAFAVVPPRTPPGSIARESEIVATARERTDIPTVWFTITTPTTATTASVTINWCDDVSLVPSSRYFTVNGAVVTTSYTTGSFGGCTAYATSSATVNLTVGTNTLYAKIRGDNFEWGEAYDVIVRELPPPPTYGVNVTPDGAQPAVPFSTSAVQWFQIANTGNQTTTFQVSATCFGAGVASGCTLSNSSKLVAEGVTDSVSVTFLSGAAGTQGRIDVVADGGGVLDEAYVTVFPYGTYAANYPVVDLSATHPGTTVERSACLSISLGAGAAYECGDLRLVHALPTVTTLMKARTPMLLFNSAHNRPTPVVAADVSLPSASGTPDSAVAKLTVDAAVVATGSWPGAPWAGGAARRIGLSYSATNTGIKSYSLEVVFFIGGVRYVTTKSGDLTVVDRRSSAFGSGWWLAGLEQLQVVGNRILWIGGDGSTRVYVDAGLVPSTGTRRWVAPAYDRPDSMFHDTTSGNYTRNLSGGLRVVFNGSGQHVSTVNRLSQTTTFAYSGGKLTTITVPPSSAATAYQFSYTGSNRLSSVAVRGPTGGSTRTTTVTDSAGLIKSILDPGDSVPVRFDYVSALNANVLARKDRAGHSAVFGYDALNRVALVADTVGATVLRDTLSAAETRGQPGAESVRSDSVVSRHNGPRNDATDATDVTTFALDRYGAPTTIKNALGYVTRVQRDDIRWPGLPTRVRAPNGRSVVALYDLRGNLRSTTDSSTVQGTMYAVTRYQWDAKWDAATQIASPTGLVTELSYDATTGNRLWQQDRRGISSRVNFAYLAGGTAVGMLRATEIPGPFRDTVAYDAIQGNVAMLGTPRGFRTTFERDSIGRVVTTRRQIDTLTSVATLAQQDSATYDLRDLVTRAVAIGPMLNGIPTQRAVVENAYDNERRATLVRRKSDPDTLSVGWITTTWSYDAIGRRVREMDGDGAVDSTYFNPAGMADSVRTRRGLKVRSLYDALGRLTQRTTDAVTYDSTRVGVATLPCPTVCEHAKTYPRLLRNASGGLTIAAEQSTFAYDSTGMRSAVNADAKVKRSYLPNGALQTDSLFIATYARTGWHAYGTAFAYDLEGRRTMVRHPRQLAPMVAGQKADSALYAYDATTGFLAQVTDPLGSVFRFQYDVRSALIVAELPGRISQSYQYDADGQLWKNLVHDSSAATYNHPDTLLRSITLAYDARGKLLRSKNTRTIRDSMEFRYSGLGHVVSSSFRDSASAYMSGRAAVSASSQETFAYDALGNVARSTLQYAGMDGVGAPPQGSTLTYGYAGTGTGRLATRADSGNRYDAFTYDSAGSQRFESWTTQGDRGADDRMSYYDARDQLYAVDRRQSSFYSGSPNLVPQVLTFEEYRYDPLGRRVMVRSQRWCNGVGAAANTVDCRVNVMRRTVWDGAQELWEIQMPGDDTVSTATLENDTLPLSARPSPGQGSDWDQNAMWGRVGYTFGVALDQPLSIIRAEYATKELSSVPLKTWVPFSIIPQWNSRGEAENGAFVDGGYQKCEVDAGVTRCVVVPWPNGWFSYSRRSYILRSWNGSVVEGKRDQSGGLYRRNRYFDPATGRFTQQDPIGLAGGLNLYGYADGDPINGSDPFGLKVNVRSAMGRAARDRLLEASPTFARLFAALDKPSRSEVNLTVRLASDANEMHIANSMDFGAYADRSAGSADGRIVYNSEATVSHMASMLSHEIIHSAGQYTEFTGVGAACGTKSGSHQSACFKALDARISAELAEYWKNNPEKASADRTAAKP